MKKIKLLSRVVSVDTEKLAKGLADMHKEDPEIHAALQFGMLNAPLMEMFQEKIETSIKKEFSEVAKMLYEDEIDAFIKDCQLEVQKRVYHYGDLKV